MWTFFICFLQAGESADAWGKDSAEGHVESGTSLLFAASPSSISSDNSSLNKGWRTLEDISAAPQNVIVPVNRIASASGTGDVTKEITSPELQVLEVKREETQLEEQSHKKANPLLEGAAYSEKDPVELAADSIEYDEVSGIVSAIGNVEFMQSGRILRAEKVFYNLKQDQVNAVGNVVLNEVTGDTYFADSVELKDKMKDGFVRGLRGVLSDGSRFTAREAQKIADLKIIMRDASYTPCEACKVHPDKAPLWAIKAKEVVHHKDEHRVSYKSARFEVAGVPVAYTPYFSHPDGTIRQKSGFLTPNIGFDSDLGTSYQQDYYWAIAPDKDLTIGAMVMTKEAPLMTGEYRQRFKDAEILMSGGGTYSSRIDRRAGVDVREDEQERGHLFIDGLWNIDDKWRAGTEIKLVSDKQYLRQYNVSNKDVLENNIYVERFSDRDYGTAKIIRFKDVRVSNRKEDQPNVLPEIYTRFLGDPNGLLGGRWSVEASALGLQREGSDQDLARGALDAGWQRRHVSNTGFVSTLDLSSRGEVYKVTDRNIATTTAGRSSNSSAIRGFLQGNLQTGYPVEKKFEHSQLVLEPLASITMGSNINDNNDIPNEDSQDVFLDATNIFNPNRFPGYDRIEDKSHATYGVRTGLYADNGYQGEIFLGQSYRFDNDDNPFPQGSGLSDQGSDFVGNISARLGDKFSLNYGMQLQNEDLSSQRHEIDASGRIGDLSLSTRYFYANALQGTDLNTNREQIRLGGLYNLDKNWTVFGSGQYDLAEDTEGLRKVSYGLDYQGQCVSFQVAGERTLTRDSSGDSGTTVMMRLGLKNLGEFETSDFSVGSTN